jgi:hypothetical protein
MVIERHGPKNVKFSGTSIDPTVPRLLRVPP